MPVVAIYIAAGIILIGVAPLPYGYYTLLRIIATGAFVWAAIVAYERNDPVLPWVYGLLAIIFNPIIKIHFPKEIWVIIDLVAGMLLILTKNKIQERQIKK